ncbi:MAG: methylmalonyl Co-A mutase-associated GTPase MeaB [Pirellulaceae bacterium]|nr:methylmalonyl Co-A mutase-associated GTPase MeaB [Planctomycetales bacterium]
MSAKPPRRRELSLDEYDQGVRGGNVAVLARALTLIESRLPRHKQLAEQLLTRLMPLAGKAIRVGITGAPGVGKSTFVEALGMKLIREGHRVAVLAVDPSSGISGGSILGDKTRMAQLSIEPNAYIRPSPNAGTLGGVASKTRETMLVCEAAGFDVVLVETVGVGQSETMVAEMTDVFVALLLPGAGDELQGIKRGLIELADVIAVNKADGPMQKQAEVAAHQYQQAIESLAGRDQKKLPRILTCSALQNRGVDGVWDAVQLIFKDLQLTGELEKKRRKQNLRWLWSLVDQQLRLAIQEHSGVAAIRDDIESQVLAGTMPAEIAAREILRVFLQDR